MAINRDFIGREYRASATYEVGREHVRRFAEAIGDGNPAYTDPEAGPGAGSPRLHRPADLPHGAELPVRPGGPDRGPEFGLDYSGSCTGSRGSSCTGRCAWATSCRW
jgi:hypothetical protein